MLAKDVAPVRLWLKQRSWWLPLGLALLGAYLSLSFLFVGIGRALPAESLDNPVLDTIIAVAPFNLKAREAKASWLREYAMTLALVTHNNALAAKCDEVIRVKSGTIDGAKASAHRARPRLQVEQV